MKKLMPRMVKDSNLCDDCTPKQLEIIKKIINHLKTNYPAEWKEGKYMTTYIYVLYTYSGNYNA